MLSTKLPWELANPKWATELNQIINNPLNNVNVLTDVVLVTGSNIINHGLGRMQQGWFEVDRQGTATVYRSAPLNNTTLTLTASAGITISIGVF